MSYLGRTGKLSQRAYNKLSFLATAGQTVKSGLSYVAGFVEVYVNGTLLTDVVDYSASNGNSVTFLVALSVNDEVTVVSLKTFVAANMLPLSGGTLNGDLDVAGSVTVEGNVGIGTDNPSGLSKTLNIDGGSAGSSIALDGGDNFSVVYTGATVGDPTSVFSNTGFKFATATAKDATGFSEKARLDSSGNLLVGKTALNTNTVGLQLENDGYLSACRDGGNVLLVNRKSSDGALATFQKDGTTVGSVGAVSSQTYIGTALTGLIFHEAPSFVGPKAPSNITALSDADISLGWTNQRFKDLHLSGGVYLGGTGAANKLDDYEEGYWTATFSAGSWGNISNFTYTKIGRLVHITGHLAAPSGLPSGGVLNIGGLPFSGNSNYNMAQLWYSSGTTMDAAAYLPANSYTLSVRPVSGNPSNLLELSVQMTYITNQ
jgi:hypothetical protein